MTGKRQRRLGCIVSWLLPEVPMSPPKFISIEYVTYKEGIETIALE